MTFFSLISISRDKFGADFRQSHDSNTLYTCILQYNIGIPTLYMENLKVRTNALPYHVSYKSMLRIDRFTDEIGLNGMFKIAALTLN